MLGKATCPVHVLGPWLDAASEGDKLFAGITPNDALYALRFMLQAVGVDRFAYYRTHDLRRGHAEDLRCSGTHWVRMRLCTLTPPALFARCPSVGHFGGRGVAEPCLPLVLGFASA